MNLIFTPKTFEETFKELSGYVVDYLVKHDHAHVERVLEVLNSKGELMTATLEAVAAYLVENTRKLNSEADELSRLTVKTVNGVDRLVANTGLTRAIYKPATDTEPAVMESNESLLTRFDLSHYQAHATGTRFGYKSHALNFGLNGRPTITVEREGNKVIQTFTYPVEPPFDSGISDAEFRTPEAGTGRVVGAITPKRGGEVDLDKLQTYMMRDDVAQETDILSVKLATQVNYTVGVTAYTNGDPNHYVNAKELRDQCEGLITQKRKNGQRISSHDFSHIVKKLGAYDVDITGLNNPIVCSWDEFPECTELTINVLDKRPTQ